MHLRRNRKAVVSTALSFMLALALGPAVLANQAHAASLFNTYNLDNRSEDASAAIAEAGQKRIESACVGLVTNAVSSLTLTVDDEAEVSFVEQSELDQVPDSVLRAASCIGVPYRSGSSSPSGFDCSGLVSYALTGEYCHAYRSYDFWAMPAVDDPQPGDVVACSAGHCGLYIGDGQMIHAPQSGETVRIEPIRGKIVRPQA